MLPDYLTPYPGHDYLTPYPGHVAACGPDAPEANQIESLIKLLVTIHDRFGNTAVRYNLSWGGSEHWAMVKDRQQIVDLDQKLVNLDLAFRELESQRDELLAALKVAQKYVTRFGNNIEVRIVDEAIAPDTPKE